MKYRLAEDEYSIYLVDRCCLFQFCLVRYDLYDRRCFVVDDYFDHCRCRDFQMRCCCCDADYHRRCFVMNDDLDHCRCRDCEMSCCCCDADYHRRRFEKSDDDED